MGFLSQGFKQAFEAGMTSVAKQPSRLAGMDPFDTQLKNLSNDLKSTFRNPVNMSYTSEEVIKTTKDMLNKGSSNDEIRDYIFTKAMGYAKSKNVSPADSLAELQDVVTNHSLPHNIDTKTPQLNLLNGTQDEYAALYGRLQGAIEAEASKLSTSQMKTNFKNDLKNKSIKDLEDMLNNVDTMTNVKAGQTLNNATMKTINKFKKKASKKINKAQDQFDMDTDTLMRDFNNPKKSVKDIIKPLIKDKDLSKYKKLELDDLNNTLDFMLMNRADIDALKPMRKEDWQLITSRKADVQKALENLSDFQLDKPHKELTLSDDQWIKRQVGYKVKSGFNYKPMKTSARYDSTMISFGGIKIRSDKLGEFNSYGLRSMPEARDQLYTILDQKTLPENILNTFLPAGMQEKTLSTDMISQFQKRIGAEYFSMLDGGNSKFVRNGDEFRYMQGLVKLHLLQAMGELRPDVLLADVVDPSKFAQSLRSKEALAPIFNNIPSLNKHDIDFLHYNMLSYGEELPIAVAKILRTSPNYFAYSMNNSHKAAFQSLKDMKKELGIGKPQNIKKALENLDHKELGSLILDGVYSKNPKVAALAKGLGNIQNKEAVLNRYTDAVNEINGLIGKINGRVKTVQALDLPDTFKLAHNDNMTSSQAMSHYHASPASLSERELAKTQIDDTKQTAQLRAMHLAETEDRLEYKGISNVDDTQVDDMFIASYAKDGGLPDLDMFYQATKNSPTPKNTIAIASRDMNNGDDVANLEILENKLFGTEKNDKYNLVTEINDIMYTDLLTDAEKFDRLQDASEMIKRYKREINSYTPFAEMENQHSKINTRLDEIQDILSNNMHHLSVEDFTRQLEIKAQDTKPVLTGMDIDFTNKAGQKLDAAIPGQTSDLQVKRTPQYDYEDTGKLITGIDSTSLDMLTKRGEYMENPNHRPNGQISSEMVPSGKLDADGNMQMIPFKNTDIKILYMAESLRNSLFAGRMPKNVIDEARSMQIKGLSRTANNPEKAELHQENIYSLNKQGVDLSPNDKVGRQALQSIIDYAQAAQKVMDKYKLPSLNVDQISSYNKTIWNEFYRIAREDTRNAIATAYNNAYTLMKRINKNASYTPEEKLAQQTHVAKTYQPIISDYRFKLNDLQTSDKYISRMNDAKETDAYGEYFDFVEEVIGKGKSMVDDNIYNIVVRQLANAKEQGIDIKLTEGDLSKQSYTETVNALINTLTNSKLYNDIPGLLDSLIRRHMKAPQIDLPSIAFTEMTVRMKKAANIQAKTPKVTPNKNLVNNITSKVDEWLKTHKVKELPDYDPDAWLKPSDKERKANNLLDKQTQMEIANSEAVLPDGWVEDSVTSKRIPKKENRKILRDEKNMVDEDDLSWLTDGGPSDPKKPEIIDEIGQRWIDLRKRATREPHQRWVTTKEGLERNID